MCGRGFLKRFVPFFLTFAAGLFIASFFVSLAAPTFNFSRGERRREYFRMMKEENQRLQDRVNELERVSSDLRCVDPGIAPLIDDVPPPPMPPVAPHAPHALR
jgi:hypothetical protein